MKYWLLGIVLFVPLAVRAQQIVIVPREETLAGNVLRVGDRVDVDGTISGDAFLFGSDVNVAGNIGGDLIVGAQRLSVTGTVAGSIRGVAGEVRLSGPVGRNVTIVGATVTQTGDSTVKGAFASLASQVEQRGTVEGSFDVAADRVIISGTIGQGGQVHHEIGWPRNSSGTTMVQKSASIGGTLLHYGNSPVTTEAGAKVGAIIEKAIATTPNRTFAGLHLFLKIMNFLSLLILGWLILWLARPVANSITRAMTDSPRLSILVGLAGLIFGPVAITLVAITIVGIPLSLIALAAYGVGVYLAKIFVAIVVGGFFKKLAERRSMDFTSSPYVLYTLGLLFLTVVLDFVLHSSYRGPLSFVNSIGNFLGLVVVVWGFGGVIIGKWRWFRSVFFHGV